MILPYDICRCTSQSCPVRETCQRFTDRPQDAARLPFSNFYAPVTFELRGYCDYFIGEPKL